MLEDDDIIREFLIESNENLNRLDTEIVDLERKTRRPTDWRVFSAQSIPSRELAASWDFRFWKESPIMPKIFSVNCALVSARSAEI